MKKLFNLFILINLFNSCSDSDRLYGKWNSEDQNTKYEFFENNKYSFTDINGFFKTTSVGIYETRGDSLFLFDDKRNPNKTGTPFFSTKLTILDKNKIAFNSQVFIKAK